MIKRMIQAIEHTKSCDNSFGVLSFSKPCECRAASVVDFLEINGQAVACRLV